MTDAATLTSFLFTDIEGSSLKWLNHRAAMQRALAEHDRILREAIAGHAGEVFKAAGDAFLAAFRRPSDAVNAAIAAQRAMAAQDWAAVGGLKVRMAVHCGTAEKREGDYYGPALNRCARLLALAHGGQVLATSACAELLAAEREVQEPLRLMGSHPLDDPAQAVGIHQVLIAGLPQDFPPLRTPETRPTNLPRHLTPLIGREVELEVVKAMIATNRLVTLTGPGGVGKTRLAIKAGLELLPRFAHGVWLVELAPLSDPDLVPAAVANALSIQLSPQLTPIQSLQRNLVEREILIVLDNCEHVVAAVADMSEALLNTIPGLRIMASSQELIGLPGEHVYRVASLNVPGSSTPTADEALNASAVQLLVARTRAIDPRFTVDDRNAATVSAVCRRLDGVALAIEMAAARIPTLGLDSVAKGLDDRFRLLTGGKRTALPRQRTLHATLDWSHALLSDNDRMVFRRLGQFAGGFTLEAATKAASDQTLTEYDVIDCLSDLVTKSLVLAEPAPDNTRYRLLETTRAYALEKLGEAGEGDVVAMKHARFYAGYLSPYLVDELNLPSASWYVRYLPEVDNFRAALATAFGPAGDPEVGIQLAVRGSGIWVNLNLFAEQAQGLDLAIKSLANATPMIVEAQLWQSLGTSLSQGGMAPTPESVAAMERAIKMYRELGDDYYLQRSLVIFAHSNALSGEVPRAMELLDEAKLLVEKSGNKSELGWYSCCLGMTSIFRGELLVSQASLTTAVKLGREQAHTGLEHWAGIWLGIVTWRLGDLDEAVAITQTMLQNIRRVPVVYERHLFTALRVLSEVHAERREFVQSDQYAREALAVGRRFAQLSQIIPAFARDIAKRGRLSDAVRLLGWRQSASPSTTVRSIYLQMQLAEIEGMKNQSLSPAEVDRLMAEGAELSEDEVCKLAVQP